MHAKFLLWASIDPYSVHWTSWLTLTRIIVWLLSIQMQIFVLYISTVSRIFGFFSNLAHLFLPAQQMFFWCFFRLLRKTPKRSVRRFAHKSSSPFSRKREVICYLFLLVCFCFFSGHTFISYCVATSTIERHSSPMNNVRLSTLTRLIINLDYTIIPSCDF